LVEDGGAIHQDCDGRPSAYLSKNRGAFLKGATEVDAALDRFENLFKDLNLLLQ
jgi:hypothetical protein